MIMDVPDWNALAAHPPHLVQVLRVKWLEGNFGISAREFAEQASHGANPTCTEAQAEQLLNDAGPWLERQEIIGQPDPDFPDEPAPSDVRYVSDGAVARTIPWTVLIHGMNTKGRWQEHLAFDMGLWQGNAPPSFVVKYGHITLGAFVGPRRRQLMRGVRSRIVELAERAEKFNAGAVPDVVAHSLGTWLLGHMLLGELERAPSDRIAVGRVIVTGCILQPDFPWAELQRAGIVQDVLNHYATKDNVVRVAELGIRDSGPSGLRGFDPTPHSGDQPSGHVVLNVEAPNFSHSQVLDHTNGAYAQYMDIWRPFLTNPAGAAERGITTTDPPTRWKPLPWPLRRGR